MQEPIATQFRFANVTETRHNDFMTDYQIVITTAGSSEEADRIASALVEAQLAACVNIIAPITSVYRWKGAVQKEQEWLLLIKTTAASFERILQKISDVHSYELPECIQIPIEAGSSEYLNWIADNVRS